MLRPKPCPRINPRVSTMQRANDVENSGYRSEMNCHVNCGGLRFPVKPAHRVRHGSCQCVRQKLTFQPVCKMFVPSDR